MYLFINGILDFGFWILDFGLPEELVTQSKI